MPTVEHHLIDSTSPAGVGTGPPSSDSPAHPLGTSGGSKARPGFKPDQEAALPLCSPWLLGWFTRYARRYLRRHFHAVRIARSGMPRWHEDRPLVVYLNHPSWWDPLVCLDLGRSCFPGRTIYAPMEAAQLDRYRFFRRLGFFGVARGSLGGARSFLRTATRILAEPGAMLWLTPQGTLADPRALPVRLEDGLGHLARRVPHAQFLPLALEYAFWNERLPEVLLRCGAPVVPDTLAPNSQEPGELTRVLARRLEDTMQALARDAVSRDPGRFEALWERRCGVNRWYDGWRRVRAMLTGHSFNPDHHSRSR